LKLIEKIKKTYSPQRRKERREYFFFSLASEREANGKQSACGRKNLGD
jgi:hypothetical protein